MPDPNNAPDDLPDDASRGEAAVEAFRDDEATMAGGGGLGGAGAAIAAAGMHPDGGTAPNAVVDVSDA